MIEVFKTNVRTAKEAQKILLLLNEKWDHLKINFDLQDCDKILRIEGNKFSPAQIIQVLNAENYFCKILE